MTDTDQNDYWTIKRGTSTLASSIYMGYSEYNVAQMGIEGNVNNPGSSWIPETELRDAEEYISGWQAVSDSTWDEDNPEGYYHDGCTDHHEDINVGTDSGVSC